MSSATPQPSLASEMDPTVRSFLDALAAQNGPPIYSLSAYQARGVLEGAQAGPVDKFEADIEDLEIEGGPTGTVSLRIVKPVGASSNLPVVLYFHGGGWVLGGKNTHDRLIRELAIGANVAVVFVDYTLSPEARYPTAIEQGFAALQWVASNGSEKGLDASRIAIAGDSAGGNLATAVAMVSKNQSGPELKFQLLFYPVTDANFDTPSYLDFAEGYFLERKGMMWFWDNYAPDPESRQEALVSPLRASREQLSGLPETLVITGGWDVLRDEGQAYARRLMEAGVQTTATLYPDTMHDFVMLNVLCQTPAARSAIAQANDHLKRLLHA